MKRFSFVCPNPDCDEHLVIGKDLQTHRWYLFCPTCEDEDECHIEIPKECVPDNEHLVDGKTLAEEQTTLEK